MLFYRGQKIRRNTVIDPADALEMCLDSDSDLDMELNAQIGADESDSDSSDIESSDVGERPGPSRSQTDSTSPPPAKRPRTGDVLPDSPLLRSESSLLLGESPMDISDDEEIFDGSLADDEAEAGDNNDAAEAGDYNDAAEAGDYNDAAEAGDYNDAAEAGDYNDAAEAGDYNDAAEAGNHDDVARAGNHDEEEEAGDRDEELQWEQLARDAAGPGPTVFEFQGSPGVNPECGLTPETATPLSCYKQFVTDEIFTDIKDETNRYAAECREADKPRWTTSVGEIKIFWALCMLMGVLGKPTIALYWSTREILQTPIFGKTMVRDRFCEILRYLHFADNTQRLPRTDPSHDPLFKVRKYYDWITTAFHRVFTPGEYISIDEGMIRFFGRLSFKTYNPMKPAKYGMKAYKVCDQTGYTWKFHLYTGKTTYRWGAYTGLVALVMNMLEGLLNQGRKVFMDNFYSSPTLFLALLRKRTNACGTVRCNRQNMPKDLNKKRKLRQGDSIFLRAKNLLAMLWRDKRNVSMLSTMHDTAFKDSGKKHRETGDAILKPAMVLDYNKHMGSVDVSDFMTAKYADMRKSLKWYKKLIFHLNDLAVTNAYIVYKSVTGKQISHLDFLLQLIEQLLLEGQVEGNNRPKPSKKGRKMSPCSRHENPPRLEYSTSDHWPTKFPPTPSKEKPTRTCEVCKPERSETRYFCPVCDVALHPDCFGPYHKKVNYRREE